MIRLTKLSLMLIDIASPTLRARSDFILDYWATPPLCYSCKYHSEGFSIRVGRLSAVQDRARGEVSCPAILTRYA
jgi:hypothetical protein